MSLGSLFDEAIRAYLLEDPSRMSSGFQKIDFGPLVETLRSRYAEVRRRRVPWVVETLRKNAKRIVMDDAQLSSFYRELSRSKTVNGEKRSRPSDENDDFIAPNGENLDDFLGSEEFLKNVREVGRFLLDRNDDNRFLRKIRSLLISGTFRSEPRALAHAICGEFGAVFLAEIDCECSMKAKDFDEIVAKVRKTENDEDSEAMKVVLLNDVHRFTVSGFQEKIWRSKLDGNGRDFVWKPFSFLEFKVGTLRIRNL